MIESGNPVSTHDVLPEQERNPNSEQKASPSEISALKPREGENEVKVVVFCNAGTNRSALYANELANMGYDAINLPAGGSNPFSITDLETHNPQVIVFVSQNVKKLFMERINKLDPDFLETHQILTRDLNVPESATIRASSHPGNPYYKNVPADAARHMAKETLLELGFEDKNPITKTH